MTQTTLSPEQHIEALRDAGARAFRESGSRAPAMHPEWHAALDGVQVGDPQFHVYAAAFHAGYETEAGPTLRYSGVLNGMAYRIASEPVTPTYRMTTYTVLRDGASITGDAPDVAAAFWTVLMTSLLVDETGAPNLYGSTRR